MEVEDYHVALTNLSWMISSKVICPWIPEFTSDNLEYYELKESEVEEDKEWLRLYADLALYTKFHYFPRSPVWGGPFELRKIIVQTREDVESKKKVKAENAIFYISFDPNQWRSSLQCYHKENNGWNVL